MAKTPFKMKGSPMKRNFGISPLKDREAFGDHPHPHAPKPKDEPEAGEETPLDQKASPMKLRDVWVENEEGVMVNKGTGPDARRYAHEIAKDNVELQHKQDVAGVDAESPEYDTGKKIEFTDEDLDIKKQAVEDLEKMEIDPYGGRFFTPESTDEERRRAVSTISTGEGVTTESDKQRKARLRKAKLKA